MPSAERLQDAPRAGLVGPDAVLHAGDDLALEPDHQHRRHEAEHEDDEHLHDHDEQRGPQQVPFEQRVERQASDALDPDVGGGGRAVDDVLDRAATLVERRPHHAARDRESAAIGSTLAALALTILTSSPSATPRLSRSSG